MQSNQRILADGRWQGEHGIARFSREVLSRLHHADIFTMGPPPLSIRNLAWQPYFLANKKSYAVYYSPGFNPAIRAPIPFVFTIHDLIHLHVSNRWIDKLFYDYLVKPAAKRAQKIVTVSQYSKQTILDWTALPDDHVAVVGSGVSQIFSPMGECYQPGFPYLLHVGNMKPHKNVARLIQAMIAAKIDPGIKLICTGYLTPEIKALITRYRIEDRIQIHSHLSEQQLTAYYRGALGVVFPSLYEGFGLPVIEAMASGVPVLSANITSLPEIAGNAAILVDPYSVDAIADGIESLVLDHSLRSDLITKGLLQAQLFTWDKTGEAVQRVLSAV